jgi:hypothetical protein
MKTNHANPAVEPQAEEAPPRPPSKKSQIRSLFLAGINDVEDIALITHTRPSYVANVLQSENLLPGYFDLYTTTGKRMNVYSKFFAGKLGFRDEEAARQSVELIDRLHQQFGQASDRAGQHHALMMALTMYNRARWTGKTAEADVFRRWLVDQLGEAAPAAAPAAAGVRRNRS